ncbi:MAG: hypothetical protein JNM27_16415 [Leptospirales bacterium]|nr:hypothetical protein [Leptospirales bacterium]
MGHKLFHITSAILLFASVTLSLQAKEWKENDRVLVESKGKTFPAIILEVQEAGYLVSYDGYASSYDEVVKKKDVKPMKEISGIRYIKTIPGKTVKVRGSLKEGRIVKDLSWAERSDIACWPGIRNIEFKGNHLFYWIDIPERSVAKITVKPLNGKRINLYGYSFDGKNIPPLKYGLQRCEASHPTWIGQPDFTKPAEPQSIEFPTVTRRDVIAIGVAGAKDVVDGDFELTIEIQD